MGRPRKRHVQQSLDLRPREVDGRGGKRKGAGRPPKGARSSERHKKRPKVDPRHPLHVTLRAVPEVGSLRKRDVFHAIGYATVAVAKHDRFRIVHLSIQATHVHLLVEAASKAVLKQGMQSFQISAAKLINRALRLRSGENGIVIKNHIACRRIHKSKLTDNVRISISINTHIL